MYPWKGMNIRKVLVLDARGRFLIYLARLRRAYALRMIYCTLYGKPHLQISQQDADNFPLSLPSQIPQEGFHRGKRNHIQIHMFGTLHTLPIPLSWNRFGRRPRSLFNTNSSKHMDFRYGHDNQKHHSARNVRTTPLGKNLPVGRGVLDRRVLLKHGRTIW